MDRKQLQSVALPAIYEEAIEERDEEIFCAETVSILTDGWKNSRKFAVSNVILSTPKKLLLFETKEATDADISLNADYYVTLVEKAIQHVGAEKVCAVVTDNEEKMLSMGRKLEVAHPHIVSIGCAPHTLNNLGKDICALGPMKKIIDTFSDIAKTINNSHPKFTLYRRLYREITSTGTADAGTGIVSKGYYKMLLQPGDTRWLGHRDQFRSCIDAEEVLKRMAISSELDVFETAILAKVLDPQFWALAKEAQEIVNSIASAIEVLESDRSVISEVPEEFSRLAKQLEKLLATGHLFTTYEHKKIIQDSIKRRLKHGKFLKDVHFAANLLDPRFMGERLDKSEIEAAHKFIEKKRSASQRSRHSGRRSHAGQSL